MLFLKNRFSGRFLCFLLVFIFLASSAIANKKTIIWLESDLEPCFIHEGPYKGMGYEDVITDILEENLKGYHFKTQKANIARMYREFKSGQNVCHVAFYKNPEREKFMYFSIPNTITFPVVLVMKSDKAEQFAGREFLSLEEMLKNKNFKLAIAEDRSYGAALDALLKKYESDENILSYAKDSISQHNFNMLCNDRIDYTLALPEEVMYWAEQNDARDKISIFHLAENQGRYDTWYGYVACPKTKWGKTTITRINKVLMEQRPTERYRKAYERWIDEDSLPRYRKLYQKYFLQTTE